MPFTIVDIPERTTANNELTQALLDNVGKAVVFPCVNRDANTARKTIRAGLSNRGILKKFDFHSKINTSTDSTDLIIWLTAKAEKE